MGWFIAGIIVFIYHILAVNEILNILIADPGIIGVLSRKVPIYLGFLFFLLALIKHKNIFLKIITIPFLLIYSIGILLIIESGG